MSVQAAFSWASIADFSDGHLDLFCSCCTREDGNDFRRGVVHRHHNQPRRAGKSQCLGQLVVFLKQRDVIGRQFPHDPGFFCRRIDIFCLQLPFVVTRPVHAVVVHRVSRSRLCFQTSMPRRAAFSEFSQRDAKMGLP